MNAYFFSLLGAAILIAVVKVLMPEGSLGKHVRLISALILLCVIAAPLPSLISGLSGFSFAQPENETATDFAAEAQRSLDAASRAYFVRAMTTHLEEKFGLAKGEVSCAVRWGEERPVSVTLILSGAAIWKNSNEMETYVTNLLGCPCDSAIG